ncbi:MAG: hypothetical protein J6W76_03655, partial [Spirochaetales bacterium]|nr:hypothetical protein [Spirochaetales bacterium]
MLHINDEYINAHKFDCKIGLELESHRISHDGYLSHTANPFDDCPYIDRDFSESQIEINTLPMDSPSAALDFLREQLHIVHNRLENRHELLWPFSNPPMIRDANDVPIAIYTGDKVQKHIYRQHLAEYYGKYMMTYSGIHYNYSFSDDILKHNFNEDTGIKNAQNSENYKKYKEKFYLRLAEQVLAHSWMVVALLAASPIADNSFFEVGKGDRSVFTGFSSLRCSEHGYWNIFSPVLDYSSIEAYTDSIESYLHQGLLAQASELYYPVRLKPIGHYTLENLRKNGISHIELRMIDLNPFSESGVALSDLEFIRLLLVWLASQHSESLSPREQLQALQNHKNASNYDWDIARITLDNRSLSLTEALSEKLSQLQSFYADSPQSLSILSAQWDKLHSKSHRYAYRVRAEYGSDYIGSG